MRSKPKPWSSNITDWLVAFSKPASPLVKLPMLCQPSDPPQLPWMHCSSINPFVKLPKCSLSTHLFSSSFLPFVELPSGWFICFKGFKKTVHHHFMC